MKGDRQMKRAAVVLAALVLLLGGIRQAEAGSVGYNLEVTTQYQFGAPAGAVGYSGSPDTSFFQITNNGLSAFTGTIGETAVSQFAGDFSYSLPVTLAPGQSSSWFCTSPESSNAGGFNGPFNSSPQPGIEINLVGTILLGAQSESVNLSVNDSSIHSGVPRTNPFGVTLDNYVLQGGDPLGRDPGDGYETTQADGFFTFVEVPGNVGQPPNPPPSPSSRSASPGWPATAGDGGNRPPPEPAGHHAPPGIDLAAGRGRQTCRGTGSARIDVGGGY
jgi:hypothetical protein